MRRSDVITLGYAALAAAAIALLLAAGGAVRVPAPSAGALALADLVEEAEPPMATPWGFP